MPSTSPPAPTALPSTRRRRWWIGVSIAVVVLGLYAAALTWTTRRLEIDIQKSIRAVPVAGATHREND
ncbi:hypothetical protein [Cognatiluteimonas profundi]|uniref:hypothetical protein n=1 Tax=Cognatiluteimonas profundi TaxID=2594501 RepID=UPI00131B5CDE|nr:hypothetical protein [Lysobacter profundi]